MPRLLDGSDKTLRTFLHYELVVFQTLTDIISDFEEPIQNIPYNIGLILPIQYAKYCDTSTIGDQPMLILILIF